MSFRQSAKDLDAYGDLSDWNETERAEIAELTPGQSLWKIGEKAVKLYHRLPATGPERRAVRHGPGVGGAGFVVLSAVVGLVHSQLRHSMTSLC